MDSPDIPAPPDPAKTAAAQTASNKETAVANANLNRVDQYTPFGSSTYKITGTNPDGTPKYEQTTAFSAPVQGLFDANIGMSQGLANIGQGQLAGLQQQYANPLNLNTEVENKIAQFQAARLDPELARQDDALRNRLTNQGIREGTEAWDRALERQGRMATDSRNQMWLSARQQGVNEALTQRNQPLMEFNSIRTGTAPNMPTFTNVPGVNMANTDVAGIYGQNYNQQLAAAQMQNSANNAFMGGLFGLGGGLLNMGVPGGGTIGGSLFSKAFF